jgi:CheY-like chemotaxis protein
MGGRGDLAVETANVPAENLPEAAPADTSGRHVMFSVSDNGVGMDDSTMKHLFEPFFTTRGVGQGSGLGLASAWGIVKKHGGFITVRSAKGAGSTFSVFLPAMDAEPVREKRPTSSLLRGSGTILVVDDEEAILTVASLILGRMGFDVLKARSGEEAVAVFSREGSRISAVLLDFVMPGMDGRETALRLRELDPAVRILIVSGYISRDDGGDLRDIPCNGMLKKPYDMGRLSEALRKILR